MRFDNVMIRIRKSFRDFRILDDAAALYSLQDQAIMQQVGGRAECEWQRVADAGQHAEEEEHWPRADMRT